MAAIVVVQGRALAVFGPASAGMAASLRASNGRRILLGWQPWVHRLYMVFGGGGFVSLIFTYHDAQATEQVARFLCNRS